MTAQQGGGPKVQYFYRDPLAAAWMAKHFGMRFLHLKWNELDFQFLPIRKDADPDTSNLYIHPDSLPLLEPALGDLALHAVPHDDLGAVLEYGLYVHKEAQAHLKIVQIIQRDSKPFHWPESEAA